MTSPEYQAPTWVNEDDPDFVEGVSPDIGAGYLNQLAGAVEDHGQRLEAITPVVTNLQNTALDQADGDARYILQTNAAGFAPAEATTTALTALDGRVDTLEAVDLAPVATSGAYTDLTGKPAIPATPGDVGAQPAGDYATTTALTTGLAAKADSTALADVATTGQWLDINGRPDVPATFSDLTGTVPTSALPALAITDVNPVADQAAMLALTAQKGDVAVRADNGKTYALAAEPASTLSNWLELPAAGKVTSVNGQQGVVSLAKGDIGLGNVDNTADTAKPVSTAQQTALDAKAARLTPTTAKTAAYTAANGDLVVCNAAAGAFTVTLPAATAGAVIAVRKDDTSENVITIARNGTDVFGAVNTVTSLTLDVARQVVTLIGTAGAWIASGGTPTPRALPDVQVFTAAGTWTKPAGAMFVQVACVGAGGGGGSGRLTASATVGCGGGGGGAGAYATAVLPASALASTEAVAVGVAGAGGAAVTVDSTNGNAGGNGGQSSLGTTKVRANGGNGGGGGTISTGTGGTVGAGMFTGTAGSSASTTGAPIGANGGNSNFAAGGGAGGGIAATPANTAGGGGTAVYQSGAPGGVAGTAGGGNGGTPTGAGPAAMLLGPGGGGGGSNIAGAGGAGGAGASYGGGGGGGGAALNGAASGAGGNGAGGLVVVTSW